MDFLLVTPTLGLRQNIRNYHIYRLVSLWTRVNIVEKADCYSIALKAVSECFTVPKVTNL